VSVELGAVLPPVAVILKAFPRPFPSWKPRRLSERAIRSCCADIPYPYLFPRSSFFNRTPGPLPSAGSMNSTPAPRVRWFALDRAAWLLGLASCGASVLRSSRAAPYPRTDAENSKCANPEADGNYSGQDMPRGYPCPIPRILLVDYPPEIGHPAV